MVRSEEGAMLDASQPTERRRQGRLSAAPLRGRPEKGAGYVEALVRATSPPFALLLAGALLRAILAIAGIEYGPQARRAAGAKDQNSMTTSWQSASGSSK